MNRNGHNYGKQNYICKQCGRQFLEVYKLRGYSEDAKKICLRMYANGMGFRAIERVTGISHNTVINWVKQSDMGFLDISQPPEKSDANSEESELDQSKKYLAQETSLNWMRPDLSVPKSVN